MQDYSRVRERIYETGNYAKVASELGVSRERVRQIGEKLGIDIKNLRRSNPAKYKKPRKVFEIKCVGCGEVFKSFFKRRKTCSRRCQGDWMRTRYSFNKLSREKSNKRYGYSEYRVSKSGKTYPYKRIKARVIVEGFIGRKLRGNECVHHIDGDIENNSLNNLVVLGLGEHSRLHNTFALRHELEDLKSNLKALRNEVLNKVKRRLISGLERRL
jgi:hypothetical protein